MRDSLAGSDREQVCSTARWTTHELQEQDYEDLDLKPTPLMKIESLSSSVDSRER